MLAYMNAESLEQTMKAGRLTFFSRSKKRLWTKGETSGHWLDFVSVDLDCDGDTLLFQALPHGPTCHLATPTCFGKNPADSTNLFLSHLAEVIEDRFSNPEEKESYVSRLVNAGLDRIAQKVGEEAVETVIAAKNESLTAFEGEAADLLFHLMVLLRAKGSSMTAICRLLQDRHTDAVTRKKAQTA